MGGNTIKTNEESYVMSQRLKPEGKSLKGSIKTNIGGNKAQPKLGGTSKKSDFLDLF